MQRKSRSFSSTSCKSVSRECQSFARKCGTFCEQMQYSFGECEIFWVLQKKQNKKKRYSFTSEDYVSHGNTKVLRESVKIVQVNAKFCEQIWCFLGNAKVLWENVTVLWANAVFLTGKWRFCKKMLKFSKRMQRFLGECECFASERNSIELEM